MLLAEEGNLRRSLVLTVEGKEELVAREERKEELVASGGGEGGAWC